MKVELNSEEQKELQSGLALAQLTQSSGFDVIKRKLEDLAFHSWVDPRESPSKQEWEWRELNAYHAANNARELLEWIQQSISRSDYLEKKQKGELQTHSMRV